MPDPAYRLDMTRRSGRHRSLLLPIVATTASLVLWLPAATAQVTGGAPRPAETPASALRDDDLSAGGLDRVLAAAFRIDVADAQVRLDFRPADNRVTGRATLRFRMREGQRRALFHFNPTREMGTADEQRLITAVRLDGRALVPRSLRIIRAAPGAEPAFEIGRRLAPGRTHTLSVSWDAPATPGRDGRLFPMFDDTEGPSGETETMWPTVSSPEELTRHRLVVRVHAERPYRLIGSGRVTRQPDPRAQTWTVDTERAVSSSNVFLAAVPADQVESVSFRAGGVPVTMLSDQRRDSTQRARRIAERTILALIRELGPFPMPRMQILLTGWDSGMEYYGATRTGWDSLSHELAHMYFATTAVNRTWRDTWIDEAITTWWDERDDIEPIGWDYRGRLAVGRPPAAPGFDEDAYGAGARVMARIARELGGDREMLDFLADVYRRRAYRPFTTADFVGDVLAAQDRITRADLERWLYGH